MDSLDGGGGKEVILKKPLKLILLLTKKINDEFCVFWIYSHTKSEEAPNQACSEAEEFSKSVSE